MIRPLDTFSNAFLLTGVAVAGSGFSIGSWGLLQDSVADTDPPSGNPTIVANGQTISTVTVAHTIPSPLGTYSKTRFFYKNVTDATLTEFGVSSVTGDVVFTGLSADALYLIVAQPETAAGSLGPCLALLMRTSIDSSIDAQFGIIKRMRKQLAVYWSYSGLSSSGLPEWNTPVEVLVRWDDLKGSGEGLRARLQAGVYMPFEIEHQSYLMLGGLGGGVSIDPREEEAWEVMAKVNTPNIKATQKLYLVQCSPGPQVLLATQVWGVVAITYTQVSGETIGADGVLARTTADVAIPVAFFSRLTVGELEKGRGRFLETDKKWEIPKLYLTDEPNRGDYLTDDQGAVWNVVGWTEGVLRSWWLPVCRRALPSS